MHLIKLNAIPSTNTFLKELAATKKLENFTTVVAENQTEGKGQRGNVWYVAAGQNLTFSTIISDYSFEKFNPFLLNILVAISIINILEEYDVHHLKIKWPNDIMSENKKIGGILIENTVKQVNKVEAIIGIGLNVNQSSFENLHKASSILMQTGRFQNKEELLEKIVSQIASNYDELIKKTKTQEYFWETYHKYLFRKGVPSVFQDVTKKQVQGIITQVTTDGKLEVLQEDDNLLLYDIKEITLLY